MAFDPDAFLADKPQPAPSGPFDPDAFLKEEEPHGIGNTPDFVRKSALLSNYSKTRDAALAEDKIRSEALLKGGANLATLGHLPHLMSGIKNQSFSSPEYIADRDKEIKREKQLEEDEPTATMSGKGIAFLAPFILSGGTAAAPLAGGLEAAPEAAAALSKADRIKSLLAGMKTGAVFGGLQNPGDVPGKVSGPQVQERLKNAGGAAIFGGGLSVVGQGLGEALPYVADKLETAAAKTAYRALGRQTQTQMAKAQASGEDIRIGMELLKKQGIPFFGSTGRIDARISKMAEDAGVNLDNVHKEAEQQAVKNIEEGVNSHPGWNPDVKPVTMTPVESVKPKSFEDQMRERTVNLRPSKPIEENINDIIGKYSSSAPEPVLPPKYQGDNRLIFGKKPIEIESPLEKRTPYSIDVKGVAEDLRKKPDFQEMQGTPGAVSTFRAGNELLDTLGKDVPSVGWDKSQMSVPQTRKLRQNIDAELYKGKGIPEMRGTNEQLYIQRDALKDEINNVVSQIFKEGGQIDKVGALEEANARLSPLLKAQQIIDMELARGAVNRKNGMAEHIAADVGSKFGAAGIPAGVAISKGIRAFGNSAAANTEYAGAKGLQSLADKLNNYPGALPRSLILFRDKLNSQLGTDNIQK